QLDTGAILGKLGGDAKQWSLDVTAQTPTFAADYPAERHLRVRAQAVTARVLNGAGWSVAGAITQADVQDTSLPGHLTAFDAAWNGAPGRNGEAVFRLEKGHGRLFDPTAKPIYHPLLATGVTATIEGNIVRAQGAIGLQEKPAKLGAFVLTHDFNSGIGETRA